MSGQKNLVSIVEKTQQIDKSKVDVPDIVRKHILPQLKVDEKLLNAITTDNRIIDLGYDMCLRFGEDIAKQANLVRKKLRTLAQIKLIMAEEDK